MSLPKLLAWTAIILFTTIAGTVLFKRSHPPTTTPPVQEIVIAAEEPVQVRSLEVPLTQVDRIDELFTKGSNKLPIVRTIVYKSKVPWIQGRPAWLADYASHYRTSRHFIARSLHGKKEYLKQDLAEGNRFNVLDPDKNITFYLLVDTSRGQLSFYYIDEDTEEKMLLKTYRVGLGRKNLSSPSGLLTPHGKYTLGERVACYHPKTLGLFNGTRVEMIRVFGTRWIPFDEEISGCTAPAAGFGLHGVPWMMSDAGTWVEDTSGIGTYDSDGCIRLATDDIEELYAIIISRPTTIEIVEDAELASIFNNEGHVR